MIGAQVEQFKNILNRSAAPLIAFKKNWTTGGQPGGIDAVASSLALRLVLQKLQKPTEIVVDNFTPTAHLQFLDTEIPIRSTAPSLRQLTININLSRGKVEDLSYDIKDGKLKIFLTPEAGILSPEDVSSEVSDFAHDLIITLDSGSLNSLGELFTNASEMFFNRPIINIDHNAGNEHYGQLNLVDFSASSTAEIIFELIEELDKNLFDEKIATLLLAGIISKTHGFKLPVITPKTLSIASRLISLGARREEIVHNFYRTRDISTLKLWGRALARLKTEKSKKLVWSILTKADFVQSGAEENVLSDVIHELISTSPDAETVVLLYESMENKTCGIISSLHGHRAEELGEPFQALGTHHMTKFCLAPGKNIIEAERTVIEEIKKRLT